MNVPGQHFAGPKKKKEEAVSATTTNIRESAKPDAAQPDAAQEVKSNLGGAKAVVFSFDTTGSMQPCIGDVRKKLRNLVEMMSQDIPGFKIGLIAHGDYCDGENCINVLDLTDDLEKIMKFITDTPNTSGGDQPECYELAINRAKTLSWPQEGGAFVLIGDATPHDVNPNNLDWRNELKELKAKNVQVFAMQCLHRSGQKQQNAFWEEVSEIGNTPLVILESFGDSANTLEALAYASTGKTNYDKYMSKFAAAAPSPGGCGLEGLNMACADSANLVENRSKLRDYVEKNTTE